MPDASTQHYQPSLWLRTIASTPKAPDFPWGLSIRLVVGLAVPFAVGMAIQAPLHILFSVLGVLLATSTQSPIAYRRSMLQVALTIPFGLAAYCLGIVGQQGIVWQALVIALASIIMGLAASISAMLTVLMTEAMIVLIVTSNIPLASFGLPASDWWLLPALFVAGVAISFVLLLIEAVIFRTEPQRRSISLLVTSLASVGVTVQNAKNPLDNSVLKAQDSFRSARDSAYQDLFNDRLHTQGTSTKGEHDAELLGAANAVFRSLLTGNASPKTLALATQWLQAMSTIDTPKQPPVPQVLPSADSVADRQLLLRVQSLAALIWPSLYVSVTRPRLIDGQAEHWLTHETDGTTEGSRIRARLTVGVSTWRNALRIAVCLVVAVLIGGLLPSEHGFWVPLIAALIVKPDFGSTFARALQRIGGTVFGCFIAIVLLLVLPSTGWWLPAAILILAFPMAWAGMRAYWLLSVFITPVIILLVEWAIAGHGTSIAWFRLLDTVIASAVVLVFGYLVWPKSFRPNLPRAFGRALERLSNYVGIAFGTVPQDQDRDKELAVTRRETYRQLSDLRLQLQRTLAEPPLEGSRHDEAWFPAVTSATRLADLTTAYAERRHSSEIAPDPSHPFPVASESAVASREKVLKNVAEYDTELDTNSLARSAPTAHSTNLQRFLEPDPSGAFEAFDQELATLIDSVEETPIPTSAQ